MEPTVVVLLLLGLAIGIVARTYMPYLRKIAQNKIVGFDPAYLWTALVSFFVALITAYSLMPEAIKAWEESMFSGAGAFGALIFGIVWAFGINTFANQFILDGKPKYTEVEPPKPPVGKVV